MIKFFSIGEHSLIWQNHRFYWVLTEQLWFWTDEWQAGEREAEEDIKAGRVQVFDTSEEFLASLEMAPDDDLAEFERKLEDDN